MGAGFDETTCDRCGRDNPTWWTPTKVWKAVYGPGGQPTRQGVLCPTCFIADAEAAGVTAPQGTPGWLVTPSQQPPAQGGTVHVTVHEPDPAASFAAGLVRGYAEGRRRGRP